MKKLQLITIGTTFLVLLLITRFAFGEDALFIDQNSNVGIGTTEPVTDLHIKDSSNDAVIRLEAGSDGFDSVLSGFQAGTQKFTLGYDDSSDVVNLNYGLFGGGNGLSIDSSGKIGIGTSGPNASLHVEGTTNTNGVLIGGDDSTWAAIWAENMASHDHGLSMSGNTIYLGGSGDTVHLRDNVDTTGSLTVSGTFDPNGSVTLPTTGISGAGAGSGLDADYLDGISSGSFLQADNDYGRSGVSNYLYMNTDTYFYRDAANRIRTPDQFYVDGNSANTYLYSTHTYLGASSGDTIHLRGNVMYGDSWYMENDGLRLGSASSPGTWELYVNGQTYVSDYLRADGGIHVGGSSDPGTDNLIVDGTANIGNWATQSKSTNGYAKIGSIMFQWGTAYSTSDNNQWYSFPTTFPTACVNVQITPITDAWGYSVASKSTTGFYANRNDYAGGTHYFNWFATGY